MFIIATIISGISSLRRRCHFAAKVLNDIDPIAEKVFAARPLHLSVIVVVVVCVFVRRSG